MITVPRHISMRQIPRTEPPCRGRRAITVGIRTALSRSVRLEPTVVGVDSTVLGRLAKANIPKSVPNPNENGPRNVLRGPFR